MGLFNLFKKESKGENSLSSVFKVAEEGMSNLQFSRITKEGLFEILMFDIWLGTRLMEDQNIDIDYEVMQNKIEGNLKSVALKLGLPVEKKLERIYIFRTDGWENDIMGLLHSDYPKTKQFLPAYMYMCIVAKPLIVYDDETTYKKIQEIPLSDVSDFLGPFCDHYMWLVKKIMKQIEK